MRGTTILSRGKRASLFMAVGALTLGASGAFGQALTWDASGSGTLADGAGNWNTTTGANWFNGAPPDVVWANGSVASFGVANGAAGNVTINDAAGVTASGLIFNAPGGGNYTIDGANALTLTGAGTVAVGTGLSPTISAPIGGSVGMTVTGPGTLNVGGNNTFTGAVAINSGGLVVAAGGNLGAATNALSLGTAGSTTAVGALSVAAGVNTTVGSFTSATNTATANTISIDTGATLNVTSNLPATGVNAVFLIGSATAAAPQVPTTNQVTISGNGTLSVSGGPNNSSFVVGIGNTPLSTAIGTPVLNMSGLANFNFTTGAGSAPTSAGPGGNEFAVGVGDTLKATVSLAVNNTITAGTIDVGDGIATPGSTGNGVPITGTASSTLNLGTGTNVLNANTILVGGNKSTADLKWASTTSTGTLTVAGAAGGTSTANITVGTASSSGSNAASPSNFDLSGHTANIQAGTVVVGNLQAGSAGTTSGGTLTFENGTFNVASLNLAVITGGTAAGGKSLIGTFTLGKSPSSTGVLNVSGTFSLASNQTAGTGPAVGTFNLKGGTANVLTNIIDNSSGTAASTTTLSMSGGTLNMNGFAIGTTAAGTGGKRTITSVALPTLGNTAVLMNLGGNGINNAGLNMNGTGVLVLEGANTYTGGTTITSGTLQVGQAGDAVAPTAALQSPVTNNATLAFGSSQSMTSAAVINGPGGVSQTGTGTTTLTGVSNYTGPTSLVGGTLAVGSLPNGGQPGPIGASASAPAMLVFTGGTLQYTGPTATTSRLFSVTPAGGRLDASGVGPISFNNGASLVSADAAQRAPTNESTGSGKITLPNVNDLVVGMSVTGTNIPGGTTILSINPSASSITVSNNPTAASNDLLSFGPMARTLTLTGNNVGNNSIAGTFSDSAALATLGLTKTGTGTWNLTGANTYTGVTTVSGGKLVLGSAAWNPVTSGAGGANVTAGRLIFDYASSSSPAATVVPLLTTAAHSGNFASGQIRSTTASATRTLGYYDDSTSSTLTVMATYFGDLNLDGRVNDDDYALLDRGAAKGLTGWSNGDVDYSGAVDQADYLLTDTAFVGQGGVLSPELLVAREAQFGSAYVASLVAAVPEPGVVGPVVVALASVGRRRRR